MYKQGDILLVPIPFSDLSSSKRRPVLVLSNDGYNKMTEDVVVVAITSNVIDRAYGVILETTDMEEGILKVKSNIRADKIYTLSKGIVVKKFGSVKNDKVQQVVEKVDMLMENEE
ncbi:MAG: type II toxin-antitoxin system PemK/MazF family toxin [Cellulosilyticaceae bacterium]